MSLTCNKKTSAPKMLLVVLGVVLRWEILFPLVLVYVHIPHT